MGPTSLAASRITLRRRLGVILAASLLASLRIDGASFVRGDVDSNGSLQITDAVLTLGYLFLGNPRAEECLDSADFDDSGVLNITDAIASLSFQFLGGAPPHPPFPQCGRDTTADSLDCQRSSRCAGTEVFLLSRSLGGPLDDSGADVAVATDGSIVLAGSFQGTWTIGDPNGARFDLLSAGGDEVFVSRFAPDGQLVWAVRAGGAGSDRARRVRLTPGGDVIVGGVFTGAARFGSGEARETHLESGSAADESIFLARFSGGTGHLVWALQVGSSGRNDVAGLETGADGGVYATENLLEAPGSGGGMDESPSAGQIAVTRHELGGSPAWIRTLAGGGRFRAGAIAVSPSGEVWVAGRFTSDLKASGPGLVGPSVAGVAGKTSLFLARFGGNGSFAGLARIGDASDLEPRALAIDAVGGFALGGRATGRLQLGSGAATLTAFTASDALDGFVARFDAALAPAWAARIGGTGDEVVRDVEIDAAGRVLAAGASSSPSIRLDGSAGDSISAPGAGGLDAFFATLSQGGGAVELKRFGGPDDDDSSGIAVLSDGSFVAAGAFEGTATLNGSDDSLTASGGSDAFLVRLPAEPNRPPEPVDDAATTPESTAVDIDVLANDIDADLDPLSVREVTRPAHGLASIEADGRVRYTPEQGFNGQDGFRYTADDGRGGSATAQVTVTVQPVNDPPAAHDDTASTSEAQAVTVPVLANDVDPDGDALIVASVTPPSNGTAVKGANNAVTYTPRAGFNGVDSFRYTASDQKGGTASAQVQVAVNPVNDPPIARDDAATTAEDTPVEINVISNDTDPEGEALAVISIDILPNGSVTIVPPGRIRWTPGLDLFGVHTLRYTISDPHGGRASANVVVTVTPVEDAPRPLDDFASTPEDTAVTIPVLANDFEPEGDALTLVSVTPPSHGTAVKAGNQATYTPAGNFSGFDSFTYVVRDAKSKTATGNVTVTVSNVNDAPAGTADASTSNEDRVVVVDVLGNDSDPDGDRLKIAAVTQGQHGSVTISGDGKVVYVPDANFSGADSFTYTVDDGKGGSRTVTVNVTVQAFTDPPGTPTPLDPDRFVPLDGAGNPIEGQVVTAAADGTLTPFEFRPSGRSLFGLGTGLGLRFTQGGRRVQAGQVGAFFLQFTRCTAVLGAGFPLQLREALSRTGSARAAIPVGPVDVRDLAVIFGREPDQGIPVSVYGRFPLRWLGGKIDEDGIEDGVFALEVSRMPAPPLSGLYRGFKLDINRRDGIGIPISGRFELPDDTPTPFALSADPSNPMWIGLAPSGNIRVTGRARALFPNGTSLIVDVGLDDPSFSLRVEAANAAAAFIETLTQTLPTPASRCIPAGSTTAELDAATLCLRRLERADRLAAASATGASPAESGTPPDEPPDPEDLSSAPLEAWSEATLTGLGTTLPIDSLETLLGLYARSASSAASLEGVVTFLLPLERARQAIAVKFGSATDARTAVDAAITEGEAAAKRASRDSTSAATLASLHDALRGLRDALAIRQALSIARPAYLTDTAKLLDSFLAGHAKKLGVAAGTFSPSGNPTIAAMDRTAAMEALRMLVEARSDARTLAIDGALTAPVNETIGQLALQLDAKAEAELTAAEGKVDTIAFGSALNDIVDLIAFKALPIFPSNPALSTLPGAPQLPGFGARLDAVMQAGLARLPGERSLKNFSAEVRTLLAVLRAMPPAVTFATPPFRRIYDRFTTTLILATDAPHLAGLNPIALADIVEAGLLHAGLGQRFAFAPVEPLDWDGDVLPRVTTRLCDVSRASRSRSGPAHAVKSLLAEADRFGAANPSSRKQRLVNSTAIIDCLRDVALLTFGDGETARSTDPLLQGADLVLPLGVRVRDAMGEIHYNRQSGSIAGGFAGALLFPNLDLSLRIQRASFSNGGSFELVADGDLGFPGGTFTIPARRPLNLHLRSGERLGISGAGRVTLENGLTFGASLTLDDPLYAFGLEAGGVKLDLAKQLVLSIPTLPSQATALFDRSLQETLSAYYQSLSAALEGLVPLLQPIQVDDPGQPPEFEAPQITVHLDEVAATANSIVAGLQLNQIGASWNDMARGAARSLHDLAAETREVHDAFGSETRGLEDSILQAYVAERLKSALDEAADRQLLGAEEREDLSQSVGEAGQSLRRRAYSQIRSEVTDNLAEAFAAARFIHRVEAEIQFSGFDDDDLDGVPNFDNDQAHPHPIDNCRSTPNPDQADADSDGIGDACDKCPHNAVGIEGNADTDGDGLGDGCDTDDDNDGVPDATDKCRTKPNPAQVATPDSDADGIPDECDNCKDSSNVDQLDSDHDGVGNKCDSNVIDPDIPVARDPCPFVRPSPPEEADPNLAARIISCAIRKSFRSLGLDPDTGNPLDAGNPQNAFRQLKTEDLDAAFVVLATNERVASLASETTGVLDTAVENISNRLIELLVAELGQTPAGDCAARWELIQRAFKVVTLATEYRQDLDDQGKLVIIKDGVQILKSDTDAFIRCAGGKEGFDRVQADVAKRLDARKLEAQRVSDRVTGFTRPRPLLDLGHDFMFDVSALVRVLGTPLALDSQATLKDYVRARVAELAARVSPGFLLNRVNESMRVLDQVIGLLDAAQTLALSAEVGTIENVVLDKITTEVASVAEAQKAWWILGRYTEGLLDALDRRAQTADAVMRTAMNRSIEATLRAQDRLARSMAALLASVERKDLVVPLPGDLQIDDLRGEVQFNRETRFLRGRLGGKLQFPETGFVLDIDDASLDSLGNYSLSCTTKSPLPFGDAKLEVTQLDVAGNGSGIQTFAGQAFLDLPNGLAIFPPQRLGVGVEFSEPEKKVAFHTTAQNIRAKLGDGVGVIFDAGFGLEVSTAKPQGKITLSGTAGLFPKPNAPTTVELLTPSNFNLRIVGAAGELGFDLGAGKFRVALDQGTLGLPEDIFGGAQCPGGAGGPAVAVTPASPLAIDYTQGPPSSVQFSGALNFQNLRVTIPGLDNVPVQLCTATLTFPVGRLPELSNLNGSVTLPLPNGPLEVEVTQGAWRLDGFPTGRIGLGQDLTLYDADGFNLKLLGNDPGSCPPIPGSCLGDTTIGSSFTICNQNGKPRFEIGGGVRFSMPLGALAKEGAGGVKQEIATRICGRLTIVPGQLPTFEGDFIAIDGTFFLGGPDGLKITNGNISVANISTLFRGSGDPFVINLGGTVTIPNGPSFTLEDARFTIDGSNLNFNVGGFGFDTNQDLDGVLPGVPILITGGGIRFKEQNPDQSILDQLKLENMIITLSGALNIPPGDDPVLSGILDEITFEIGPGGQPIVTGLNGIGMGIQDLILGPLVLQGKVFLGNLGLGGGAARGDGGGGDFTISTDDPFFAGLLGGTLDDVGIKANVAFSFEGPIGVCLDVNAGPAGIPLGPTGFLLTGASGGLAFADRVVDPCDFLSLLPIGDDGKPRTDGQGGGGAQEGIPPREKPRAAATWETVREWNRRYRFEQELSARATQIPKAPADGGGGGVEEPPAFDCPPPSISILCQPHPDPSPEYENRVIFKFSSLKAEFVDDVLETIGISKNQLQTMTPSAISTSISHGMRVFIEGLLPPTPADLREAMDEILGEVEAAVSGLILTAAQTALGANKSVYDAIVKVAYDGIPCPTITLKLAGTFSHATVSTFLSAVGSYTVSYGAGVGLGVELHLAGIPVGRATGFFAATDSHGDVNPTLCGKVHTALGPLELGELDLLYRCDGCVNGLASAIQRFTQCFSDNLIREVVGLVAPQLAGYPPNVALSLLTPAQASAFVAQLLSRPDQVAAGLRSPGVDPVTCFTDLLGASIDSFNPEIFLSGDATPRIFGIPLSESPGSIDFRASKQGLSFGLGFSPSYVIGNFVLCVSTVGSACSGYFPALDQATLGFSVGFPDLGNVGEILNGGLKGKLEADEILAIGEERLLDALEKGTLTFGYQISPFGFKLADGEGRMIMPNLTNHPADPSRASPFVRPENRNPPLPSRLDVLSAALDKDFLANPTWHGDATDLPLVFDDAAKKQAVTGKSFTEDYFPHGGILGAGHLDFPNVIVEAPPPELFALFGPQTDLTKTLQNLNVVVNQYLLATTRVGSLAFYAPAPNPPSFVVDPANPQSARLRPAQILESLQRLALDQVAHLYSVDQAFLKGFIDAKLFGLDLARADIVAEPPSLFRLTASLNPQKSPWLKQFVSGGSLRFTIRTPQANARPTTTVEESFEALHDAIQALGSSPTPAQIQARLNDFLAKLANDLPKVSLEATLPDFHLPPALQAAIRMESNATSDLFAYSPRFEPSFQGQGPVAEARKNGGIACRFRRTLNFFDVLVLKDAMAELGIFPGPNGIDLSGQFHVDDATVLGAGFHDVNFFFNSAAKPGELILSAAGGLDSFDLTLLQLKPLNGTNRIHGVLEVRRGARTSDPPSIKLVIDPAQVQSGLPFVDNGLTLKIHGTNVTDPFSFATTGPWSATVEVSGKFSVKDPASSNVKVLDIDLGSITTALTGNGLSSWEMKMNLNPGLRVVLFPGRPQQQEFNLTAPGSMLTLRSNGSFELKMTSGKMGFTDFFRLTPAEMTLQRTLSPDRIFFSLKNGSAEIFPDTTFKKSLGFSTLEVDSTLRFLFDTGNQDLSLPVVFSANGALQIGFEPNPKIPGISIGSSSLSFGSVDVAVEVERLLTVTNSGQTKLAVTASSTVPQRFAVTPGAFTLDPGRKLDLRVGFIPGTLGAKTAKVNITTQPPLTVAQVSLNGTGVAVGTPELSDSALDFDRIPLGNSTRIPIVITNIGSADLNVTGITAAATIAPFKVSPNGASKTTPVTVPFTLAPRASRRLLVHYVPTAVGALTRTLTFTTSNGSRSVTLTGEAFTAGWWLQRDGQEDLLDISTVSVANSQKTVAVGRNGLVVKSDADGRVWTPERFFLLGGAYVDTSGKTLRAVARHIGGGDPLWIAGEDGFALRRENGSNANSTLITDPDVTGGSWFAAAEYRATSPELAIFAGKGGKMARETAVGVWETKQATKKGTLSPRTDDLVAIRFSGVTGLSVGLNGTILKSADSGATWSDVSVTSDPKSPLHLAGVDIRDSDKLAFAVGTKGSLLRSTNLGTNWTPVSSPILTKMGPNSVINDVRITTNAVFVVGLNGVTHRSFILRSIDAGLTWAPESIEDDAATTQFYRLGVAGSAGQEVLFAAGKHGAILQRPLHALDKLVSYSTDFMNFGQVQVSSAPLSQPLIVRNRGSQDLTAKCLVSGAGFSTSPAATVNFVIPPDGFQVVTVTFTPPATPPAPNGVILAGISIQSDDSSGKTYQVTYGVVVKGPVWTEMTGAAGEFVDMQFLSSTRGLAVAQNHVYRTTDGGKTWPVLPISTPGDAPLFALGFAEKFGGFVAGGKGASDPCSEPGCKSTLLFTDDEGNHWALQSLPVVTAVMDVHAPAANMVFAVTAKSGATDGDVIYNVGAGWKVATRPVAGFSGGAVHATSTHVFASSVNRLYRTTNPPGNWVEVDATTSTSIPIKDIFFTSPSQGWTVASGRVRVSIASGGAATWQDPGGLPAFLKAAENRRISFLPSDSSTGWIVGRDNSTGVSQIFRTTDGGHAWTSTQSVSGQIRSFSARGRNLAWAAGTTASGNKVWRFAIPNVARGQPLLTPVAIDFGEVDVGASVTKTLTLKNTGDLTLSVLQVLVSDEEVRLSSDPPASLAVGAQATFDVTFTPRSDGDFTDTLSVLTDGRSGIVTVPMRGRGVGAKPAVVITSDPEGLPMLVDSVSVTTPKVFYFAPGSKHRIEAPETQSPTALKGSKLVFQSFSNDGERVQTIEAKADATIVAQYAPAEIGSGKGGGGALCDPDIVALPQGPYIRLCGASLGVDFLDFIDFGATGDVFVSARAVHAAVTGQAFQIPENGPAILDVGDTSWSLDFDSGGPFRFTAQSPDISILGRHVTPEGQVTLDFNTDKTYKLAIATSGNVSILPGLFQLTKGTFNLERKKLGAGFETSIAANTNVRLFKRSNNTFIVDQPITFKLVETCGVPFNFPPLPNPLLDLGFLKVRPGSLSLTNKCGIGLALSASNFQVELFGKTFTSLSADVDSDGFFAFHSSVPATLDLGPFKLETSGGQFQFRWNVRTGELFVDVPAATLKGNNSSVNAVWPSGGVALSQGFTIDSNGDFTLKIDLPEGFTFDGMSIKEHNDPDLNFLKLKRSNGDVTVKAHGQVKFFGATLTFNLHVGSSGAITATLNADLTLDLGVLGKPDFGDVTFSFRSNESQYQFQGDYIPPDSDDDDPTFRLFFGTHGAAACSLFDGEPAICVCASGSGVVGCDDPKD